MPDNIKKRTPTPEVLGEAFPSHLAAQVAEALAALSKCIDLTYKVDSFEAFIAGETVKIPARIHFERTLDLSALAPEASIVAACLMSRSTDGHARQTSMRHVLRQTNEWALPFIFALIGEYVVEILDDIYAALPSFDRSAIQRFVSQNRELVRVTRARVPSYWDAYYRRPGSRQNYVGFKILELIDDIVRVPRAMSPSSI